MRNSLLIFGSCLFVLVIAALLNGPYDKKEVAHYPIMHSQIGIQIDSGTQLHWKLDKDSSSYLEATVSCFAENDLNMPIDSLAHIKVRVTAFTNNDAMINAWRNSALGRPIGIKIGNFVWIYEDRIEVSLYH